MISNYQYLLLLIVFVILFLLLSPNANLSISLPNSLTESFKNIIKKDKIAFIFLTIGEVKQHYIWKHFFKQGKGKYNIYVHPKFPFRIASFFRKHVINNLIATEWGEISLVEATLNLIKEALKDKDNKKIILVSDSCIPIKKFKHIYNSVLADDKSWFNYYKPDHIQGSSEHLRRINLITPKLRKNAYINEQWMILDRKHAELVVNNEKYVTFFRTPNLIPDEMFFVTLLHHLDKNIKNKLKFSKTTRQDFIKHNKVTHAKWYDPALNKWNHKHPFEFTQLNRYDILQMKKTPALFARKFSTESDIHKYWKYIIEN